MTLGQFIQERRKEIDLTRNQLAIAAGISHTEVHRIETGDRKQPSLKVLCAIADALTIPQEDILKAAGYAPSDDTSAVERAFPGLKSPKQRETIERIADGLSRNSDLKEEDLEDLYRQVEMFIGYAKRKTNSD
jgi:transcriptional regulator with XRE-family HTH domain